MKIKVTYTQLTYILPKLAGLYTTNHIKYQDYIDANPTLFSSAATVPQAMVNLITPVPVPVTSSITSRIC